MTAEDNAKLTYSSDNNGVVRVDENGNVTIAGVGAATITVKSEATTSYKAGSKTIRITVNAKPQPNQTPLLSLEYVSFALSSAAKKLYENVTLDEKVINP